MAVAWANADTQWFGLLAASQNMQAGISNSGSELNESAEDFDGTNPLRGVNPASGVAIYYYLPTAMDSIDIEMTITDKNGNLVRHLSSKEDKDYQSYPGAPPAAIVRSEQQGLRALYVALTRSTKRLTIVHSEPLPPAMA